MNNQEFEKHIKENINADLYTEETAFEDRRRVMLNYPNKKPIYICAFPSGMIKSEPDNNYLDLQGGRHPSQPEVESKINNFLLNLKNNLELYD